MASDGNLIDRLSLIREISIENTFSFFWLIMTDNVVIDCC